jgi:hypothetical protein
MGVAKHPSLSVNKEGMAHEWSLLIPFTTGKLTHTRSHGQQLKESAVQLGVE